MEHEYKRQLEKRPTARAFRTVHPTHREVLLARLLLRVCDRLWSSEEAYGDPVTHQLYDEVKSFAEETLRSRNGNA